MLHHQIRPRELAFDHPEPWLHCQKHGLERCIESSSTLLYLHVKSLILHILLPSPTSEDYKTATSRAPGVGLEIPD
jgi:hypothetical protein